MTPIECPHVIEKLLDPKDKDSIHVFAAPCLPKQVFSSPDQVICPLTNLEGCKSEKQAALNRRTNESILQAGIRGSHRAPSMIRGVWATAKNEFSHKKTEG